MRRALLHVACALLMLVAQHGALTHAVWHLHDYLPAHGQGDHADAAHHHGDDESSSQSRLCELHSALGTLLSGDCGGQPALATPALAHGLVASTALRYFSQPATIPPSRAPPVSLLI